jgi:hypothetical protein
MVNRPRQLHARQHNHATPVTPRRRRGRKSLRIRAFVTGMVSTWLSPCALEESCRCYAREQFIAGIAKVWEPRPKVFIPDYEEAMLGTGQGDVE